MEVINDCSKLIAQVINLLELPPDFANFVDDDKRKEAIRLLKIALDKMVVKM